MPAAPVLPVLPVTIPIHGRRPRSLPVVTHFRSGRTVGLGAIPAHEGEADPGTARATPRRAGAGTARQKSVRNATSESTDPPAAPRSARQAASGGELVKVGVTAVAAGFPVAVPKRRIHTMLDIGQAA